ncbi:Gti1/Pac2 family-domain-containing protein [Schizophyllum amplum]|uniref:Gti1/Pac2 family-domain-containing protein n=1 Tax=Schizophyllum amplum TaxID=97359 RepID=A0A550C6H8_9AGAR|nr:Gti1/Pac2 family-domain-containing protein [Auriculariopsis ampla]
MQHPTLMNTKIRSTQDALQVFSAVARTILPLITHRLDAEERRAICSGNVYVWEERSADTAGMGMERWTDGLSWGPSRVRDEFLYYQQKDLEVVTEGHSRTGSSQHLMRVYTPAGNHGASAADRLIKQTYSVHVTLPQDRRRGVSRKWHLTAYFSQSTLDSLRSVESVAGVGDYPVPDGWFRGTRSCGRAAPNPPPSTVDSAVYLTPPEKLPSGSQPVSTRTMQPPTSRTTHASSSRGMTRPLSPPPLLPPASASTRAGRRSSMPIGGYVHTSPQQASYTHASPPPSGYAQPSISPGLGHHSVQQLAPLEYLESLPLKRRSAMDEEALGRLKRRPGM